MYPDMDLSESFSALDWTFENRELVLLILRHNPFKIHALALMERMHGSGGSGKRKMRMAKPLVVFDDPIAAKELPFDLEPLISTPERLRRLEGSRWNQLVSSLLQLRPKYADQIKSVIEKRTQQRRLLETSERALRLNEQRDGVGLALDIGGLDRPAILKSMNIESAPDARSVLDMLDDLPVQERSLLEHDRRIFDLLLGEQPTSAAIFDDGRGRSVRVVVVDRDDLETVLGVDLIIYNSCYDNFVLLQYKRMRKELDGWSYPVAPSSNLHGQLAQMRQFKLAVAQAPHAPKPSLWSYRLNQEPFFFKFCEQHRPESRDESLIPGITMPAEHLDEFLGLPEAQGARGGILVGYHNCPRYLNNTEFIQLAKSGWIGTSAQSATLLREVLEANRHGGRQAMLAVIEPPKEPSAAARGWR
ncbi:hypothetical protein DF022_06235 [Burkholderia cepacia]|nr:hypothetical protein DF022_06235 [Burkholderia cepacia]RRA11237.1 hypothetical protein DF054_09205 [Burkholderia cepacia]